MGVCKREASHDRGGPRILLGRLLRVPLNLPTEGLALLYTHHGGGRMVTRVAAVKNLARSDRTRRELFKLPNYKVSSK